MALEGLTGSIGIHSGGSNVHSGLIKTINFIGAGNTFAVHNDQVDVSISGSGGGGGAGGNATGIGSAIGSDCGLESLFVNNMTLTLGGSGCDVLNICASASEGNMVIAKEKNITISTGSTVTICSGTTIRTNALGLF